MFPDPLLAVPDAIPQVALTMLPALLAGPGAVAIVVLGAVAIAAGAALVRSTRTRAGASADIATNSSLSRIAPLEDSWEDVARRPAA